MDFQEFLTELDKLGFGLVAANTYLDKNNGKSKSDNCIYVMVAGRGKSGKFYKQEGKVEDLSTVLLVLLADIKRDIDD